VGIRTQRHVTSVPRRKRRYLLDTFVPVRPPFHAEPLPPALRRLEAVRPVGEFDGRIARRAPGIGLLREPERWIEVVALLRLVPRQHGRHAFSTFEHDVAPPLERFATRLRAIDEFCKCDRMRLVPDDERHASRTLASIRPDHLR